MGFPCHTLCDVGPAKVGIPYGNPTWDLASEAELLAGVGSASVGTYTRRLKCQDESDGGRWNLSETERLMRNHLESFRVIPLVSIGLDSPEPSPISSPPVSSVQEFSSPLKVDPLVSALLYTMQL